MIFLVALAVFLATGLGGMAMYWWLEGRKESLPHRFKEIVAEETGTPRGGIVESAKTIFGRLRERFAVKPAGESVLVEMLSGKGLAGARLLLNQAGHRSTGAYGAYIAFRWAAPAVLSILAVVYAKIAGMPTQRTVLLLLAAVVTGVIAPDMLLRRRIRKRQEEITDSLPDALDLLVVCVEAGLGLNASFVKITEEFSISSPTLSEEFDVVNREMVAGKPRQEALRALADRTGVEDVKSLVAMLVQTEKLGTSLAQSLRVHSDSLRTRRRQRAEEAAAKTTIKLVFPLVFLLFPSLFIVILGPGIIQMMKVLAPAVTK